MVGNCKQCQPPLRPSLNKVRPGLTHFVHKEPNYLYLYEIVSSPDFMDSDTTLCQFL